MLISNKTSIDFNTISYLDTKEETFILTNNGTTLIDVNIVSNSLDFHLSDSIFVLGPSKSKEITVTFNPQTIAVYNKTLTVSGTYLLIINLYGTSVSAGIYVDKNEIDFGDVSINSPKTQNIIVSNISEDYVNLIITSISSTNEFFSHVADDSYLIKRGEALQLKITFTPASNGLQTGQLLINSNDILLSPKIIELLGNGSSTPNIITSVSELNFGNVEIGAIKTNNFKITNIGVANLNVTRISSSDPVYYVTPSYGVITPNNFLDVAVSFSPIAKNYVLSKILIESNDPDTPSKYVNLQGIGISPTISVSPLVLDFNNATVGEEKTKSLLIQNSSQISLIISNITFTNTEFYLEETFPITISSSKSIDVIFKPISLGTKEGIASIYSNDIDNPKIDIIVQGSGVHPDIVINPPSIDFGNSPVGLTKSSSFDITNLGLGTLTVSSITSSSPMFVVTESSLEIESRQVRNVSVLFTPTSGGSKTGTLTLINNDPDSPDISLSMTGYGAFPSVQYYTLNSYGVKVYSPESLSFESSVIGESKTKQVSIQNVGRVDLSVSITSTVYQFTIDSTDIIVTSESIQNITISFMTNSIGDFTGSIDFTTNDPDNSTFSIDVSGSGVSSPKIEVSPATLLFSDVPVGGSQSLDLTVSNEGTQILDFTTSVSNPLRLGTPQFFTVIPTSGHVDVDGSTTLSVSFRPTDLESLSGSLKILSNDVTRSEVNVPLEGTVIPATLAWVNINTEQWIPKSIYTIATTLTQVIDPLIAALGLTTQVLNVVKLFIIDLSDPMKILFDQIKKTIDDFITDLSASGLYAIYIMPGQLGVNPFSYPQYFRELPKEQFNIFDVNNPSWFDCVKGGFSSFVSKLTQSFDDPADGNRPQFSDNAMVGGYVMLFDSGTVGPDDVAKFIRSIQKLMKLFRSPFKVAFEPPSNVSCFAGNQTVRVTFTPSVSVLPKEYFIFRSETQGGDFVYYNYEGKDYPYHDENGNPIRSYKLIGVTNVIKQLADIMGVKEENAETKLKEVGYGAKELSKVFLNGDPVRFVYEDTSVENDKTYYYVVAAGYTSPGNNTIPTDIQSSDFDKKLVNTVDPETSKIVQSEENPRPVSDTKIMAMGSLSAEVSAMPINSTIETKGGLFRCRNFRCGFDREKEDKITIEGVEVPDFITISNSPIFGSVRVKVTRGTNTFTANSSSYRIDYTSKKKEDDVVRTYEGVPCKIFIKSRYYFKVDDILEITYKVKMYLNKKRQNDLVTLDSNQTFLTTKKPIDSTEIEIRKQDGTLIPSSQVMVLNDKDGRVKVSGMSAGIKLVANYDYFSDFSDHDYFKCVRSEYSRYFFDIEKCDAGTTLCTGYDNANCYYNNGTGCTNTEKSQRSVFTRQAGIEPEDIAFNKFWDPISCQNGMMQQRCDGYSKTYPRYAPKVWPDWSSVKLSAIGLFPKIEEIMKIMQQMLDSLLAGTEKMSSAIANFIDLLQKKIDSLTNLLQTIKSFLVVLTEDFVLPDLYFLRIPYGRGGNEYLKTSIEHATNGPEKEPTAYTAGAMFVYGNPGLGDALKLFFH